MVRHRRRAGSGRVGNGLFHRMGAARGGGASPRRIRTPLYGDARFAEIEMARGVWRRVGHDGAARRGRANLGDVHGDAPGASLLFRDTGRIDTAQSAKGIGRIEIPPGSHRPVRTRGGVGRRPGRKASEALRAVWRRWRRRRHHRRRARSARGLDPAPRRVVRPDRARECEQFAAGLDTPGGRAISCYSQGNGGLLLADAPLALLPGTTLRWAQKMERIPSSRREDAFATHDYLSIAVEFDNGRDLTYYWSSELPVGTLITVLSRTGRTARPTSSSALGFKISASGSKRTGPLLRLRASRRRAAGWGRADLAHRVDVSSAWRGPV